MGAQEIVIVLIAVAAAGYLLHGWVTSAKRETCGGCGCGCGDKRPSNKHPSTEKG